MRNAISIYSDLDENPKVYTFNIILRTGFQKLLHPITMATIEIMINFALEKIEGVILRAAGSYCVCKGTFILYNACNFNNSII